MYSHGSLLFSTVFDISLTLYEDVREGASIYQICGHLSVDIAFSGMNYAFSTSVGAAIGSVPGAIVGFFVGITFDAVFNGFKIEGKTIKGWIKEWIG